MAGLTRHPMKTVNTLMPMREFNPFYVYCMTNHYNRVLYIGVTNDLYRRVKEHKSREIKGFTYKYNCEKLVYFEIFDYINDAIARETQLKNWKREWKNKLIETQNPTWEDLALEWEGEENSD
jgi:putative endonuclease